MSRGQFVLDRNMRLHKNEGKQAVNSLGGSGIALITLHINEMD